MRVGDVLGNRFRLDARIGTGGMGVVYRAVDDATGDTVAVKVLDAGVDRARARREATALAALSHPSIVRYVADGITDEDRVFLAMEWADGVTMAERIADEGFSIAEAVAVARQIASALAAAHADGIVHRDVKPSNIILLDDDLAAIKLIDFGVARFANAAVSLTRTGMTMGTPGYMAPEQARGDRRIDPAADIFGLGCLLYECASGRPAFSGNMAAAVMTKILLGDPIPLRELCDDAPDALCRVLDAMLVKDPARRLADGAAAVTALDDIGAIARGPRRHSHALVDARTERPDAAVAHCVVVAARGPTDDTVEPPSADEHERLVATAAERGGAVEILATGGVVGHFAGDAGDVAERAAMWAADARGILAGWVVVVSSSETDVATAVDRGTAEHSALAVAAIFDRT